MAICPCWSSSLMPGNRCHPDDAYAARVGQRGKTELWHVLEAAEEACLYLGVAQDLTREELERRIAENTVEEVLKKVSVTAGESYFIPAGTLHAIGAGCLIYEVQQSSNLTYRVYDYGRVGADGKPRQLHIEDALAVSTLTFVDTTPPGRNEADGTIVCCPYFTLREVAVEGEKDWAAPEDSFCHLLCVEGEIAAVQEERVLPLAAGSGLSPHQRGGRSAPRVSYPPRAVDPGKDGAWRAADAGDRPRARVFEGSPRG